ncbi:hypothetical protein [Aeromicrobium sp.]|uniref:hypothetical protein n=1 Tax=Aeromicrobium sp. TaxID=1871063 RepID=UPI003D6C3014
MGEKKDDFDEIVKRLDLDLPFPEERPRRDPEHPSVRNMKIPRVPPEEDKDEEPDFDDLPDEPFYRKVQPAPIRPRHRGRTLAWIAVLGSPVLIMVFTLLQVWLAKPVLLGIGFTFVAGSIYLISQLPEHGPGRPDWPDDGAAL